MTAKRTGSSKTKRYLAVMMSYSRCFSLMAPFCFLTVAFGLNEWSKTVGSDGTQIWNSTSDFVPVQSQSFGSIKIGRIMTVEFDFVFWGRTNDPKQNQREMFFRIGYDAEDGKGCDGQQSQYPSFWLSQDDDTLIVINSEEGDCTHRYDLDEYGAFSIGIAYHIHIAFDDDTFSIHISGGDKSDWINQWPRSPTSKSHLGDEVPIWFMSDRFGSSKYNRANGTFSDMIIISRLFTYEPTTTTIEPTTTEPTTEQTLEETKMSQPSSVTSPTVTSAAHLAKGPTADSDSNSSLLDLDSIITEAVGVILLAVLLTLIYCSFNKWRSRRFEAIERSVTELTDAQSFSRTITETATLTYPVPGLQNNISDRPALTPNNSRPVSPSASQRQRLDFKNNALAVVICIAHYDDPTYNIVGIEKDYHNLRGLFQFLNFDMIPMNRNKPFYWTQEEVIHLLTRQIKEALFKGKDDAQYDALIVCISSHGSKGSVITSDLKQIEKDVIHRAVSHYHPELRQIPRFFVIDACDGLYLCLFIPFSITNYQYCYTIQVKGHSESVLRETFVQRTSHDFWQQ